MDEKLLERVDLKRRSTNRPTHGHESFEGQRRSSVDVRRQTIFKGQQPIQPTSFNKGFENEKKKYNRKDSLVNKENNRVRIRLTKSHHGLKLKKRHHKSSNEIKEANLPWTINLFTSIYSAFGDAEFRIVRLGFKYHGFLASLIIFLMFFLGFAMCWDYAAVTQYEVPYMSFLQHAGVMPCLHFCTVLLNMYSYTIHLLKEPTARTTFILGIGMIVHPILFFVRCIFEKVYDSFISEAAVNYDSYNPKKDYDPIRLGYEDHHDRFINNAYENQDWSEFVDDRYHYLNQDNQIIQI